MCYYIFLCHFLSGCSGVYHIHLNRIYFNSNETQAYLTLLYFIGIAFFTKLKARPSTRKKMMIYFILILDLSQWSETKHTISLKYVCIEMLLLYNFILFPPIYAITVIYIVMLQNQQYIAIIIASYNCLLKNLRGERKLSIYL